MTWVLHAPSGKLGDLVTKVLIFAKIFDKISAGHETPREDLRPETEDGRADSTDSARKKTGQYPGS